jgi:GxxExxY protein
MPWPSVRVPGRRELPREREVGTAVVEAALVAHRELGPGLLETVYTRVLAHELTSRGWRVEVGRPIPVHYKDLRIEEGFRADLLVGGCVLVELKSVECLARVHHKQVLTYLRLSGCRLGYLINFGAAYLKEGLVRVVNGLPD